MVETEAELQCYPLTRSSRYSWDNDNLTQVFTRSSDLLDLWSHYSSSPTEQRFGLQEEASEDSYRPKHKTSTNKTTAHVHVILLTPAAVLWVWPHAEENQKNIIELLHAPQLLLPWLTQTWLSILDQPGSVLPSLSGRTQSTHPGHRQTNGRLTQVLEHFKRNLLKTSVSKMLKSLHKRAGSVQHCCARFSLWSFLMFPKQISRAILMTPPQERQTTSGLQQIKNNCYTKKGKKSKRGPQSRRG